jgi:hypothetical protein
MYAQASVTIRWERHTGRRDTRTGTRQPNMTQICSPGQRVPLQIIIAITAPHLHGLADKKQKQKTDKCAGIRKE